MALQKKIYGVERLKSAPFSGVHGVHSAIRKSRKPIAPQSEIANLRALELQLELVRNQGNELRIGGFSFGIGNRIAKESL